MIDQSIHPNTRVLLDAWRRMQADPKGHGASGPRVAGNEELIERIFVLELMQDRTWLVRSAGSRLDALIGRRLVNHNFLDLWSGPDRTMTGAFLEAVRLDGGPGVVRGVGETLNGQRAEIEITLMPLDAGAAQAPRTRMLGLYQPLGSEAALAGQPLFRHRVSMIVPPDTRRAGPKLRLVASR
ncbi:PAS domain-containing protein [Hyphomonas sp.]|uniref:PAS domain-containing protein n=1 Tax=Hyphomonas sp. TaxID=87 RepID=UPI003919918A